MMMRLGEYFFVFILSGVSSVSATCGLMTFTHHFFEYFEESFGVLFFPDFSDTKVTSFVIVPQAPETL